MDFHSGIYRIRNVVNGKCYYGSSVNLPSRKSNHFYLLRKGAHHSIILQHAWKKHGEASFVFEIVTILETLELLVTEQKIIHRGDYNINKKAKAVRPGPRRKTSAWTGKKHSTASRRRMSESAKKRQPISNETRVNIREAAIKREAHHPNPMLGRTQAVESRRKISEDAKRRYAVQPKYHSPETRRKMAESGKENWVIRKQQEFEDWWCSLAARHHA